MTLPSPETMETYASILEAPGRAFAKRNEPDVQPQNSEIALAAALALRTCAANARVERFDGHAVRQLSESMQVNALLNARIQVLRRALEDIRYATMVGRVCPDVAWFDSITTLHDFCTLKLDADAA